MFIDTLMALWLLLAPGVAHGPPPLPADVPPALHAPSSDRGPTLDPDGLSVGDTERGPGWDPDGLTAEEPSGETEKGGNFDPNG